MWHMNPLNFQKFSILVYVASLQDGLIFFLLVVEGLGKGENVRRKQLSLPYRFFGQFTELVASADLFFLHHPV
jgi:hypothetical protein